MEDRKSEPCINQVENHRRVQFSNSVNENISHSKIKQYRRDILLQLRLHPLSLQKPENLPAIEVVKNKLYLHSIIDSTSSADKYMDSSTYQASLKPEHCSLKHDYPLLPHYFNRLYPFCFSPHLYNGPYQNSSSKFRSPFHAYYNPLKKHCIASHSCYKDFPEECVWTKRNYSSSEDVWNYPSHVTTNFTKKRDSFEAVPKSRKKLSIIDPVTGKNVLEAITTISCEKQREINQEDVECPQNYVTDIIDEKYAGDCFCNGVPGETSFNLSEEDCQDSGPCSSEEKIYYEKIKEADSMYQPGFFDKALEGNSRFDNACENKTAVVNNGNEDSSDVNTKEELVTAPADFSVANENVSKVKTSENIHDTQETNSLLNKQVPKKPKVKETIPVDIHGNCQSHYKKDFNFYCGKENVSKQSDIREGLKQLREKIYSLKQEQQKMAILQSFLRYKRYQLEESARNLDEKRIEIANWECTLYNKAKRLHDKELWLDNRSEILFNKAQQLAEKEKILNKEEGKFSNEFPPRNDLKEAQFSDKKFLFDHCIDTSWDEIPSKVKSICGEENNEYNYFTCGSNSNKTTENSSSNVEKCKSDVCSLDELERNIVLIEKMNSSNEAGDISLENKTELSSTNPLQKKDDSTASDPLGCSKGRRYLPEHIKYWLNKRDKSAL